MIHVLEQVEKALPAPPDVSHIDQPRASDARDEEALDILRAHRAPRTVAAVATTCRSIREFIMCNEHRVRRMSGQQDPWDRILEAWIAARLEPERSPWLRPKSWRGQYNAPATKKAVGSWRAAMERLRYATPPWPRSTSMLEAVGAGDVIDAQHSEPIFLWELLSGLRDRPPCNTWERCGAALLVVGGLYASRTGNSRRLTVGSIRPLAEDTVSVVGRERPKPARDRASAPAGKHAHPARLKHWAIGAFVIPWWHYVRRAGVDDTGFLFPSLVRPGPRIVRTANGRELDDLWMEPLREWSDRATAAVLRRFVPELGPRSFRGLRAGNNIELRRSPLVSDVTRRRLHGRSVRELIGSEIAYNEVFAEDFTAATFVLGRAKFLRQEDGLLTLAATSASACERDDWVEVQGAVAFPGEASSAGGSGSDTDDDSADARVDLVCFRCNARVRRQEHGFLCDIDGCRRGTCVACHPGGERAQLRCPAHERLARTSSAKRRK
jgi:hypothetical protein